MLTTYEIARVIKVTGCGNAELLQFLTGELSCVLDELTCSSNKLIEIGEVELDLVDLAIIWARQRVDSEQMAGQSTHNGNTTAATRRNMDAENTGTGRNCTWSGAVSQKEFARSSTDDVVSFAEGNMLSTAYRALDGFDKSSRTTLGNAYSRFLHSYTLRSNMQGQYQDNGTKNSSRSGGTSPMPLFQYLTVTDPTLSVSYNPSWITLSAVQFFPPSLIPNLDINGWPFNIDITPPIFSTFLPEDNVTDEVTCPICSANLDGSPPYTRCPPTCECPVGGLPSIQQGAKFAETLTIAIPLVGTFKIAECGAHNFRRSYRCFCGSSNETENATHTKTSTDTRRQNDEDIASSRETGTIIHLVRRHGISTRRGNATLDGEEHGFSQADGHATDSSNRDGQTKAFQQTNAESLTVGNSASTTRDISQSTIHAEVRKYGQLVTQLVTLRQLKYMELIRLYRQFSSIPLGARMNCIKECLDVYRMPRVNCQE